MKIDPKRLRLYAVTDRAWTHDAEGLLRQVAAAVDGGAGIVQLREKHMGQADFLAEAERFVALCREKGAVSIINDNVEIAAQTGAELLGWGVNGNTTGGMLAVLPDLLVREHPDAVLLMGGTNDIAYGGDLAGARANMGAMAHLIIAGGGLPLIGIPPGLRRPIRREWAELMPERAAELLAEYQSWLRRFAAAFRLPVLDFDRAFTRWGEEGLFQPDGLHPNAAGHCLMAETAAALIRSL